MSPGIVAYSICRQCAAVYPAERRCPACDGDRDAAATIAAASAAHAAEPVRLPPPRRAHLVAPLVTVSVIMLGLGVGLGWAFAAHRVGPLMNSSSVVADR